VTTPNYQHRLSSPVYDVDSSVVHLSSPYHLLTLCGKPSGPPVKSTYPPDTLCAACRQYDLGRTPIDPAVTVPPYGTAKERG